MFVDDKKTAIPISNRSFNSRGVARSVLHAEAIAFADLLDDALAVRKQLEFMFWQATPVHMITDSKSRFDIIAEGSRTGKKRIMIDKYAARKAYKAHEIK